MARIGRLLIPTLLAAAFGLLLPPLASAHTADDSAQNLIKVRAEASALVDPDVAYLELGVRSSAEQARTAMDDNAQLMRKVLRAIGKEGVPPAQIRTSQLSLQPQYRWTERRQERRLSHYEAVNRISVTLYDFDRVALVLAASVDAGANFAGQMRFALRDADAQRIGLLAEATATLEHKARTIARALNRRLSGVRRIVEGGGGQPHFRPGLQALAASAQEGGGSAPAPVHAGQISLSVVLTGDFELLP